MTTHTCKQQHTHTHTLTHFVASAVCVNTHASRTSMQATATHTRMGGTSDCVFDLQQHSLYQQGCSYTSHRGEERQRRRCTRLCRTNPMPCGIIPVAISGSLGCLEAIAITYPHTKRQNTFSYTLISILIVWFVIPSFHAQGGERAPCTAPRRAFPLQLLRGARVHKSHCLELLCARGECALSYEGCIEQQRARSTLWLLLPALAGCVLGLGRRPGHSRTLALC
jgi:hypothetical protein